LRNWVQTGRARRRSAAAGRQAEPGGVIPPIPFKPRPGMRLPGIRAAWVPPSARLLLHCVTIIQTKVEEPILDSLSFKQVFMAFIETSLRNV
jgi:hypothetical protein